MIIIRGLPLSAILNHYLSGRRERRRGATDVVLRHPSHGVQVPGRWVVAGLTPLWTAEVLELNGDYDEAQENEDKQVHGIPVAAV